jgi:hypothetical protein
MASYCFIAVQRPVQPSEREKTPLPPAPERWPDAMVVKPFAAATARNAPLGPTDPPPLGTLSLPPAITPATLPDLHPATTNIQAPSNRETPPPRAGARRASGSLVLRREERSGSMLRVPDTDLSSLPILPPLLPCAKQMAQPQPCRSNTARTDARSTSLR